MAKKGQQYKKYIPEFKISVIMDIVLYLMETKLTAKELAGMIDHTLLKQFATFDDLKAHFQAAKDFGFKIQP